MLQQINDYIAKKNKEKQQFLTKLEQAKNALGFSSKTAHDCWMDLLLNYEHF